MNSRVTGPARNASTSFSQDEGGIESAFMAQDLASSLDCFSEIDTESRTPESNKISYLEQLLRLHEPPYLSETQRSGRRFVLDMLRVLCLLPDLQQAQEGKPDLPKDWEPTLEFKYLVYLFERTASPSLAEKVRQSSSILSFDGVAILQLREWLSRNGLAAHELALIQPNFFRGQKMAPKESGQLHLHPKFAELSKASVERNHDYLVRTFFGLSHPLLWDAESATMDKVKQEAGLEEAMAPVFQSEVALETVVKSRLKPIAAPQREGEPPVALSFVYDETT
ncbi:MAG: hypothetical protein RLZZ519_544 [Bacteroidota bacterium]|jgi:hypothetical protein